MELFDYIVKNDEDKSLYNNSCKNKDAGGFYMKFYHLLVNGFKNGRSCNTFESIQTKW